MTSKTLKEWTATAPLGVKETVAAKARKRRETHRALTEIRARAPRGAATTSPHRCNTKWRRPTA